MLLPIPAGPTSEWAHKLPEEDEGRWRDLEKKRRELAKEGKVLPVQEYEEWLELEDRKFPGGRQGEGPKKPEKTQGKGDLKYDPSPKHRKGGWGTEMDLDDETAQQVLNNSIQSGKQCYGYTGLSYKNSRGLSSVPNRTLVCFKNPELDQLTG